MEVEVVPYTQNTTSVQVNIWDFHSVTATMMMQQLEHTVMMWGYLAH